MKFLPFFVLALSCLLVGCSGDFGTVTATYTKGTAIYGDLESLRQTPLVGPARNIEDAGKIYLGATFLLIGEEGQGIHMLDNSNPENPTPTLFMNIPANREYYVEGNYLYAESLYDMVKINISNLNAPTIEARANNAFFSELTNNSGEVLIGFEFEEVTERLSKDADLYEQLVFDQPNYFDYQNNLIPPSAVPASFAGNSDRAIGTVNRIAYLDDYVYVIGTSKITTFDASSGLESVYSEQVGWGMETIYPFGDKLFIGSTASMSIFDVSIPDQPQFESFFTHATACDPVFPVSTETAYVTLRTGDFGDCPGDVNSLLVLDISTPNEVLEVQAVEMLSPFGLTMIGNMLYVGEGENGLKIFNARNQQELVLEEWDQSIRAYDVLAHPTRPDLLMIAGPDGLSQYETGQNFQFELLSQLNF